MVDGSGLGPMEGPLTGSEDSPLNSDSVKAILVLLGFLVAFFLVLVVLS